MCLIRKSRGTTVYWQDPVNSSKFTGIFRNGQKGFALIAALMALWVLAALGILVFTVTTQDVRISSRSVGEKKAFLAAESGVAWLSQNFDPANPAAVASRIIDPGAVDQNSTFAISAAAVPTSGPAALPSPGFEIGGGQVWGQTRWEATVTGRNTNYNSRLDIEAGIGYGPVDITTLYR